VKALGTWNNMHRLAACAIVVVSGLLGPAWAAETPATSADEVVFARDIQPVLAKHCLECHGPDKAEAGLRLDVAERAYAELESGNHAIVAGKAGESELIRRVTSNDEFERMPPEGESLSAEQIAKLRSWIDSGAKYERHWAYRSVEEPALPEVQNSDWVRNPIDRFVLARLEEAGIAPSPQADRATLIKRLYFDLLGLPPTPQEVDALLADESPGAYERLVDRLLQSKHFGERWGRHWLDKARYADSDGYEKDRPRPNAWRYRDWVIEAVNNDMPLDRFAVEQLAGDLLPEATADQKLATAFHRQTLTNTEGGTDKEEFRVEATFDRTETTAAVWMALTLTCARCHSHKYDQITQHEYYQLFSFFNDANEANTKIASSAEALARYREQKAAHDAQVAELTREYQASKARLQPQIDAWIDQMSARLAASSPQDFQPAKVVDASSSGGAELTEQPDGSLLLSGKAPEKDKYTLVIEAPAQPLTGLRIETLTHKSLGNEGPGRTAHGNFVLSEAQLRISDKPDFKQSERVEFASAEADFAQDKFAPQGVLSSEAGSGWAISPETGNNHHITLFARQPISTEGKKYLQVVLDQQYGSQHTIGCFRVSTMTGLDPLRSLPKPVVAALKAKPEKRTAEQKRVLAEHVASLDPEASKLADALETLKKKAPKSPMMDVRVIGPAERKTHVLRRGDFLQPTDEVDSGALEVVAQSHPLEPREKKRGRDRLDLARWLVDSQHPLTPRVIVNQAWAHLFGQGIVPTVNDFGVRGEQPSHPELLDWLAWQLPRELGWSRKALIKTIVISATYRQSSRHRTDLSQVDPTNRLLARQNRLRAEAEIVRDLYLAASGLLSRKIGGPSVFPPLPPGVASLSYANNFKWKTSSGEDRYRRGMYTFFKRTAPHPNLVSFDCPDSNTTELQRTSSNTPLQALVTLNNEVFTEASQAMARRVLREGGSNDLERLTYGLRLCIARRPDDSEIARFRDLLEAAREHYQAHPEDAKKLTNRHAAAGVAPEENAAWVATLRMVMNLDEFIVRD